MDERIRKALTSRYLLIPLVLVVFYGLAGFFAVPSILRWFVPRYAEEKLGCLATVDTVRINPFLLTIDVGRFSLRQADSSPLVSFNRLFVDLEALSVFRQAAVLRRADLDRPDIHLVIEPDGSTSFARFMPPADSPPPAETSSRPLPFDLRDAAITGGRIAVVDRRQHNAAAVILDGLDLSVQGIATVADRQGTFRGTATTGAKETIRWEGEITLSPLKSAGTIAFESIQVASLWQFFQDSLDLAPPSGRFDLSGGYRLDAGSGPLHLAFTGMRLAAADLELKRPAADTALFRAKRLELDAPRFDLAGKELQVGRLLLEDGGIDARIDDSGRLNLQEIFRRSAQDAESEDTPAQTADSRPPPAEGAPFRIGADAVEIRNMAIGFDDRSRGRPLRGEIAAGDLTLQAEMEFGGGSSGIVLRNMASELRGVQLTGARSPEPLLALGSLSVAGGTCDLQARSLVLDRVALSGGGVAVVRDAQGDIDWLQLFRSSPADGQSERKPPAAGQGWSVLVKTFAVEGLAGRFTDLVTSAERPVVSLQGISGSLNDIDGVSPSGFTAGFRFEQGGEAQLSGTVDPAGPTVEAVIDIREMTLTALQQYLEPHLALEVQSASGSSRGKLRYGPPGDEPRAAYEGSFSLNALRLADPATKKPYLEVDAISSPRIRLTMQPNRLDAEKIRISGPKGELIINEDRTLNLSRIFRNRPDGDPPPRSVAPQPADSRAAGGKEDFTYRLSRVDVENGDLVFADLSLPSQFRATIHSLKGSIAGLAADQEAQARVRLDGQVNQYGLAKIDAVLRPGDFRRSSDIRMDFRNIEMKSLSPYSGKFAGRLIKSGKISADLKYTLVDAKMTGDNRIIIDNLVLGDRVDNPDAADLPLDLAVALLRDANGRIDIGLPVTGDLNDPKFNVGSLVGKLLASLITKTATAPFQVLAMLLGGKSENIDRVEFDPGSVSLLPPEREKLLRLASALHSRPQLRLVIQGRYSPREDGMELKKLAVRRAVVDRREEAGEPDERPDPLDLADSGTRDILENLYRERFGEDSLAEIRESLAPEPADGQAADGRAIAGSDAGMGRGRDVRWAEELFNRLADGETVTEEAFVRLAESRTQAVTGNLEKEGRIAGERLTVRPPEPQTGEKRPTVRLSLEAM